MATKRRTMQCIVLDMGGVLMGHDRDGCLRALRQFLSDEDIYRVLGFGNDDPRSLRVLFEKGQLDTREFISRVLAVSKPGTTALQVTDAWNAMHAGIPDDVWTAIRYLRTRYPSYPLILFSNTDPIHWEHVLALYGDKIKEYFTAVYLSFRYGTIKPDKIFFELLNADLGADPRQTWFVDDTEANRLAAQAYVGWQTCADLTELFTLLDGPH